MLYQLSNGYSLGYSIWIQKMRQIKKAVFWKIVKYIDFFFLMLEYSRLYNTILKKQIINYANCSLIENTDTRLGLLRSRTDS